MGVSWKDIKRQKVDERFNPATLEAIRDMALEQRDEGVAGWRMVGVSFASQGFLDVGVENGLWVVCDGPVPCLEVSDAMLDGSWQEVE